MSRMGTRSPVTPMAAGPSWDLSVGPVRPLALWRRRASLNCLWRQPGASLGAVDAARDRQHRIVADLFMTPQEVKPVMRCPSGTRPPPIHLEGEGGQRLHW